MVLNWLVMQVIENIEDLLAYLFLPLNLLLFEGHLNFLVPVAVAQAGHLVDPVAVDQQLLVVDLEDLAVPH